VIGGNEKVKMGGTQMANKEAFLNRLADKLGRPRVHEVNKPQWQRNPWDHFHQGMSQEELVNQFEETLIALGGEVIRVASRDDLSNAISTWLSEAEARNIVAWHHQDLSDSLHLEQLSETDQRSVQLTFWDEQADAQQLTEAVEKADVGFTVAEYGLSETGTIVLYNRGNCGRLVSLLPTICATVLSAQNIIPRLTQLLPEIDRNVADHSCINLITGPSRSADIEMDLSIGVHGPGQLVVFLIDDHIDS
jgi:L-lactate dehydrogenase complex protein LldG